MVDTDNALVEFDFLVVPRWRQTFHNLWCVFQSLTSQSHFVLYIFDSIAILQQALGLLFYTHVEKHLARLAWHQGV